MKSLADALKEWETDPPSSGKTALDGPSSGQTPLDSQAQSSRNDPSSGNSALEGPGQAENVRLTEAQRRGHARAAKLTPERRREIARMGAKSKNSKFANCESFDLYPSDISDLS